jgi:hypothetical protein
MVILRLFKHLPGQEACPWKWPGDVLEMSGSYMMGMGKERMKGEVFSGGIIILTTIPISKR